MGAEDVESVRARVEQHPPLVVLVARGERGDVVGIDGPAAEDGVTEPGTIAEVQPRSPDPMALRALGQPRGLVAAVF